MDEEAEALLFDTGENTSQISIEPDAVSEQPLQNLTDMEHDGS